MSLPDYDTIDDDYTVDPTRIFDPPDEWEREYDSLAAATRDLRERVDDDDAPGPSVVDSGDALLDSLQSVEDLVRRKSRLELYAELRRNVAIDDDSREAALRRARSLAADVDEVVNAVRREVARADPDRLAEYRRTTDGLDAFDRYLDDVRRHADHVRSAEVESVLSTVDDAIDAPVRHLRRLTTETFDPPTVERPDGSTATLTMRRVHPELRHPNRDYRRRVYEAYVGALNDLASALAGAIADRYRAAAARAEARNFDSVRDMAFSKPTYPDTGLHVDFPAAAHDAMLDGVRANLDPHHRRLRRRREALGVDVLRPWDRHVPLVDDPEPTVPYDRARDLVVEALEPLGTDYRDRVAAFLDERRVDVYEAAGKRGDIPAYCPSSYDSGAFILLNFQDDVRTTFFLAHELGHAMHVEYLREANRPVYATGPRPVEEVPSLLHELLLADHLLDGDDPVLAAHAGERLVSTLDGNLFNAARSSLATHEQFRALAEGEELSFDRLTSIYGAGRAEFHDPIDFPDDDRWWLGGSHGRAPYHHYQYVLGATGALVVADRLRRGTLSAERYREFLRSTGRRSAVDGFASFDVDVTDRTTYERAAMAFGDYLNRVDARRD